MDNKLTNEQIDKIIYSVVETEQRLVAEVCISYRFCDQDVKEAKIQQIVDNITPLYDGLNSLKTL